MKRQLIINSYRTAEDGLFTLASLKITKASQVQTFVSVPGRFAPLDLSTALTDGQPYYGSASLEAVLESSEGTRAERQERIDYLVNLLDGHSVPIVHPDHPDRYLVGRVQVNPEYNDLVHCRVKVSAVCEPWLYSTYKTVIVCYAVDEVRSTNLVNSGRLAVVPTIEVIGAEVTLTFGAFTRTLSPGAYQFPDIYLTPGSHLVTYQGDGTARFIYREAVLAE